MTTVSGKKGSNQKKVRPGKQHKKNNRGGFYAQVESEAGIETESERVRRVKTTKSASVTTVKGGGGYPHRRRGFYAQLEAETEQGAISPYYDESRRDRDRFVVRSRGLSLS